MADGRPRFADRDTQLLLGQAAIGADLREATAESPNSTIAETGVTKRFAPTGNFPKKKPEAI